MEYPTYLQKLLATGNIDQYYVGLNIMQIPVPSDNLEEPPTFIFEGVLVLNSEDGTRYSITAAQLEIEKDLLVNKYPEAAEDIIANYNTLKAKMEVA